MPHWDERRQILIPGDEQVTIAIATHQIVTLSQEAIAKRGRFSIALSGGSTPKQIYQRLTSSPHKEQIPWNNVWLFWSDERAVKPDHSDSNYKMAMEAGFNQVPIPKSQIFRMKTEEEIEKNALAYEASIFKVNKGQFDLIMLGVGEDGHTASLFPDTAALKENKHLVAANFVPQKNTWRMTLTFPCLNQARQTIIYALGSSKKAILKEIFTPHRTPHYPIEHVGTKEHPALWVIDEAAAESLKRL